MLKNKKSRQTADELDPRLFGQAAPVQQPKTAI
jgi:hypothetical protein